MIKSEFTLIDCTDNHYDKKGVLNTYLISLAVTFIFIYSGHSFAINKVFFPWFLFIII